MDSIKTKEEWLQEIADLKARIETLERTQAGEKFSQEALRFSDEKFSKIFKSSPDMVMITSMRSGLFLDVNNSGEKLIGYSAEELVGHASTNLNIWYDPEDRVRMVAELNQKGSVRDFEASLCHKSGKVIFVSIAADTIEIQDQYYIIAVVRDITERKKMERALKNKMADLERMNKFMVDRELKMLELKKRIRELEAGQSPKLPGQPSENT
jgi:PAS domain S-box-containing protein